MYGAILGDIIGSPYEFDRGGKTKDFPLFSERSHFTDDTVMTIAVAEALLDSRFGNDAAIRAALVKSMRKWGKRYPNAGYGARFAVWLRSNEPKPYGSCGNGSAMRVSSAGWLFDTLEQTRHAARLTAEVTHDHPEGIKGAEATASAIFLARSGKSKNEIREYISGEFGYDLSRSCDEIRPGYHHVETCQRSVPEAITAFLEGESFEDVIRTAVSLGGDTDTVACIAGSIAEAFYGVPLVPEAECKGRLPEDMRGVLDRFDIARRHGGDAFPDDYLSGNFVIEEAISRFRAERSDDSLIDVLEAIRLRMRADGHFLIPVIPPEAAFEMLDPEHTKVGDVVHSEDELRFGLHHLQASDGKLWLAAFTSTEEYEKGETVSLISNFIGSVLEGSAELPEEGIIINPWGESFALPKALIRTILEVDREENR